MSDPKQQLVELVRKVDSEFHDPKLHGQGVVISWNRKKNEWASGQGKIGKLLTQKNLDYYFVKVNSKPIHVKKIPFEWFEGTSDVSLTFEANFQIKISGQQDAEKFVSTLIRQNAVSVDEAFYQIIDQQLHTCMDRVYASSNTGQKNLLDEFYLQGAQKGENSKLDAEVTDGVNWLLNGEVFRIGFALRNAPDRVADFSHCTTLKKSPSQKEFNVQSECTLKLSSYQSYKKSGINNLDDVIIQMKTVIDQAIHEYVSGKTLFDLFSNFESSEEDSKKSISKLVRERVESESTAIGYELQSFYSLPDVAPLKLLNGIRIDIDETDGAFSTGYGGGSIKINAGMDVKAVHGSFEKLMHLLSPSGDYENIDVLEFSYGDLVQRIKKPIISICANVIKQKDYKTASTDFKNTVRKDLEEQLESEMDSLYGLKVIVKSLFPVETEDSSRLRELSGRSQPFSFSVISHNVKDGELLVEFKCAFKVLAIDLENGWDAFEKSDFGYRSSSPVRKKFQHLSETQQDYDRNCKSIAIDSELKDISDEIVRHFKADLELVPDLFAWYRDADFNQKLLKKFCNEAVLTINKSRGLKISIENIIMDDDFFTRKAKEERDRKHEEITVTQVKKGELVLEQLSKSMERKTALEDQVAKQKASIMAETEDIEALSQMEEQIKDPLKGVSEVPESIAQSLNMATKGADKSAYTDVIEKLINQKQEKPEDSKKDKGK